MWTRQYDYRSRSNEARKMNEFSTDENGFYAIPPMTTGSNYSGFYLKLNWNNDRLITDNLYQYPYSEQPAKPSLHTSFFTDRAIYRPARRFISRGSSLSKPAIIIRSCPDRLQKSPLPMLIIRKFQNNLLYQTISVRSMAALQHRRVFY